VEITEVRIKLMEDPGERLQAFCSITFDDCFVIRDLKIIEGSNGPFVAMPSRKLTAHCSQCGSKNHLRAAFCNHCGTRLKEDREIGSAEGRIKLYADIAHPINSACREMIQNRVIDEFASEKKRSVEPGYKSRYDDFDVEEPYHPPAAKRPERPSSERAHVRPGTPEPRPPHTGRPARATPGKADAADQPDDRNDAGFGAGIF